MYFLLGIFGGTAIVIATVYLIMFGISGLKIFIKKDSSDESSEED